MSRPISQVCAVLARHSIDPNADAATFLSELNVRGWEASVEERASDDQRRRPAFRALALKQRTGPALSAYRSRTHRLGSGHTEVEALRRVLAAVLELEG